VTVRNVGCNPTRDGRRVLRPMGAALELFNERNRGGGAGGRHSCHRRPLRGVNIGAELVARTIDEYPILAIAGAIADASRALSIQ